MVIAMMTQIPWNVNMMEETVVVIVSIQITAQIVNALDTKLEILVTALILCLEMVYAIMKRIIFTVIMMV